MRLSMEDSIVPQIQSAISAERTTLQQIKVERNEVLRVLYRARFVDADDIHKIESRFAEKIESTAHGIEDMERHVQELMGNA